VVLRHYTELSRILGEVTKCIYRKSAKPRSVRELMRSVQSINADLSKWDKQLPGQLRFDPEKLTTTRESVSTFSHYYQCINMTARPLLFHVVRRRLQAIRLDPETKETTDWKDGLSPTTTQIIDRCISAAEETIRMMAEARRRDLLATYGYMDGEHVFSAAIVLVMVCAAFPTRPPTTSAMNVGLDLLREMAERGWNSHMNARYELLAHLRSVFLPGEPSATPSAFSATAFSPVSAMKSPMVAKSAASQGRIEAEATLAPSSPAPFEFEDDTDGNEFTTFETISLPGPGPGDEGPSSFTIDENMCFDPAVVGNEPVGDEMDYQAWQEGYGNPALNAGLDLSHWHWT